MLGGCAADGWVLPGRVAILPGRARVVALQPRVGPHSNAWGAAGGTRTGYVGTVRGTAEVGCRGRGSPWPSIGCRRRAMQDTVIRCSALRPGRIGEERRAGT